MIKTFPKGGIHPPDNKLSANRGIEDFPLPKTVNIPVAQHLGVPASILVKRGDMVKAGQLIAKAEGFVSANIHSSVSGKVAKVEPVMDSSGYRRPTVIINVEGDEWEENINRGNKLITDFDLSPKEIIDKILAAGLVGMGGATFPSHVKLSIPEGKKAEFLIINGVECEPYLTADHALMLEKGEEILVGISIMMKALGVNKAMIGIENNKPDAINHLTELSNNHDNITVHPLKVKYPQGGEKQLIKALTGREVPSGKLPVDVGAVVFNVGTVFATYEAVQKNKPLMERIITVTGMEVKEPKNFRVRIGTPVSQLVEAVGGLPENTGKVINGGPMMGRALNTLDIPVVKGSSGLLFIPSEDAKRKEVSPCIRCTKCVSVCPMMLEPYLLKPLTEKEIFDKLESNRVMDCIECGSCSFICPANIPLLDWIRLGKARVGKIIRTRKK